MKRIVSLCAVVFSLFITSSLYAQFGGTYIFTGNGLWTDASKWSTGTVPNFNLEDNITINGTCTWTINTEVINTGTLTIMSGGSLTFLRASNDPTARNIFRNENTVKVEGTFNINVYTENWKTIDITGTLNNANFLWNYAPLITIESTGTFNNSGTFYTGDFTAYAGGVFNNTGKLGGVFKVLGGLTNGGIIAPGNSPGTGTVTGDYTATASSVHEMEVAGNANGKYDRLAVSGTANLNGALNVTLLNGYVPTATDNIPIITGTISGTFSSVSIPSQYVLMYYASSVNLVSPSLLPVTFVSLDVRKENSCTKLTWKVASEQSVLRYEVEKSSDGRSFKSVGSVSASGLNQYSFTDASADGKTFYRIKSVDKDGRYNFSVVIDFAKDGSAVAFKVLQNAAHNSVSVQHPASGKGSSITITSMDGRLVKSLQPKEWVSQTTIDVASLKAGAYVLRFDNGRGKVEIEKFIK